MGGDDMVEVFSNLVLNLWLCTKIFVLRIIYKCVIEEWLSEIRKTYTKGSVTWNWKQIMKIVIDQELDGFFWKAHGPDGEPKPVGWLLLNDDQGVQDDDEDVEESGSEFELDDDEEEDSEDDWDPSEDDDEDDDEDYEEESDDGADWDEMEMEKQAEKEDKETARRRRQKEEKDAHREKLKRKRR